MASDRISVRLSANLRRRLAEEARARAKRESEIVREALQEYFLGREKHLTCYDLARRAGVIGALKNAPPDLSTNRKHFEGFGRR